MTPDRHPLDIPDFLRFQPEERKGAWKGKRLRWTRDMAFDRPVIVEDPATAKLRKQVEAAERAKAERKAKERSDAQRLERRRTSILKQEVAMAHSTIGPKEAQLRNLRNQKPVRIVKITTIEKPAPIIEAQPQETTMSKTTSTAKKTAAKKAPKLTAAKIADRMNAKAPKRAVKAKVPKAAKTARDPAGTKTIRPGSKLEIVVGLLTRKEGCTTAEALAATDWPAISFNQQAKAAGITLRKVKEGKVTRYYAA